MEGGPSLNDAWVEQKERWSIVASLDTAISVISPPAPRHWREETDDGIGVAATRRAMNYGRHLLLFYVQSDPFLRVLLQDFSSRCNE